MPTVMRCDLKSIKFCRPGSTAATRRAALAFCKLVAAVALPRCAIATSSVAAGRFIAKMRLMEQADRYSARPADGTMSACASATTGGWS